MPTGRQVMPTLSAAPHCRRRIEREAFEATAAAAYGSWHRREQDRQASAGWARLGTMPGRPLLRRHAHREAVEARLGLHMAIAEELLSLVGSRCDDATRADLERLGAWLAADLEKVVVDVFCRAGGDEAGSGREGDGDEGA